MATDSQPGATPPPAGPLERSFESVLWCSRLVVLVPVICALLVAIAVISFATIDAFRVAGYALSNVAAPDVTLAKIRLELLAKAVKVVDLYLVGTFLLIFAMGLYELFIGKIDMASRSEVGRRLLLIQDLDDLKDRLAKIVLLIMAMLFLESALRVEFTGPLDLLYLALGVLVIAGALYLSQKRGPRSGPGK